MRYWLSVGAIPTTGVQHLLEKHDFCPKRIAPFGSQHKYAVPDKVYKNNEYLGFNQGRIPDKRWYTTYKAKLQEQMNIVERKKRMAAEILANPHA